MKLIEKVRISAGSASKLKMMDIKFDVPPTTCYLMTYTDETCQGECQFCPQGTSNHPSATEQLSRVQWPKFEWTEFLTKLNITQSKNSLIPFQRICLQTLNYSNFFEDALSIISQLHTHFPKTPISAAIPPVDRDQLLKLRDAGLNRIGIALDACTPELFEQIKNPSHSGPYRWDTHFQSLQEAKKIFGNHLVTTHLIVGLGESEEEMILFIDKIIKNKIQPGIFLFTPVAHTPMAKAPRPSIIQFRHIQLARFLLLFKKKQINQMIFDNGTLKTILSLSESELRDIIDEENAFYTAGCPGCNRPYYTSRPGKEPDGFPRKITQEEKRIIFDELSSLLDNKLKNTN